MLLQQFFDEDTFTYTYLVADLAKKLAALIDPVDTHIEFYLSMLKNDGLELKYVLDTHTHADHISANGLLRQKTGCKTLIGEQAQAKCIDQSLKDGDILYTGAVAIEIIHTPGHTDDSFSFFIKDKGQGYLFTGDTLLINGSGRTDFQNGDARDQYHSLFEKLLTYPGDTIIYPGHDYNGLKASSVKKELEHNPRLQVKNEAEYIELMNNLNLPNPKYMDVAVPANRACGDRG